MISNSFFGPKTASTNAPDSNEVLAKEGSR
jgi:hypothetical protein